MPTKSKSKSSSSKKPQVKMADLKPKKDAKGGRSAHGVSGRTPRPNVN